MSFFLVLSVVLCGAVSFSAIALALGMKKMGRLGDINVEQEGSKACPLVSIIVPACNEEKNIEQGLLTLIGQDYENLEIIVINDRSTDRTGQVVQSLQTGNPEMIVHEVLDLPKNWMGKSHALAKGAALASGEYLVFTDADVLMERTAISRAMQHVLKNKLDHLTLVFKNITGGWLLNSLILDSGLGLLAVFRPWAARKKRSLAFVGIGAFNLVRKEVYNMVGGHESIRMHPIDDMMLGKRIKYNGFRQDCLLAYDYIAVPWYNSVRAMVDGLQKNMFAVLHYRILLIPVVLFILIAVTIVPFWGAILGDGLFQAVCMVTAGVRLIVFYTGLRTQNLPGWYLPGAVITPYLSIYIILKSVRHTVISRGIFWRGQHYELDEMKKSEPLLF